MKLKDKIAVITGGGSGIGLATAQRFIEEGATVVITGRSQDKLNEAVAQLGPKAIGARGDAADLADLDALFAMIKERFGRIDVLFLNAGVAPYAPLEETDEALYDTIMNINVKGPYFAVKKALPLLSEGASIVLNTSIVNQKGFANFTVYSASKAALRSLARTLSAELLPRGARVNAVSPGPIETPIWGKTGMTPEEIAQMGQGMAESVPLGRFGKADEIAAAALYLASDESSYMVGSELAVDGGLSQL